MFSHSTGTATTEIPVSHVSEIFSPFTSVQNAKVPPTDHLV